jgi:hypothetical protein
VPSLAAEWVGLPTPRGLCAVAQDVGERLTP